MYATEEGGCMSRRSDGGKMIKFYISSNVDEKGKQLTHSILTEKQFFLNIKKKIFSLILKFISPMRDSHVKISFCST